MKLLHHSGGIGLPPPRRPIMVKEGTRKSRDVSDEFRKLGNSAFGRNDQTESQRMYNFALLYAPEGSSQQMLAFANRSAVLFEVVLVLLLQKCSQMKEFQPCANDIDRALCLNDGAEVKQNEVWVQKLQNRLESAKSQLKSPDFAPFLVPGLHEGESADIAGLSAVVVLRNSAQKGRELIAKSAIAAGSVLIVDEAYVTTANWTVGVTSCIHCYKRLPRDWLPCKNCAQYHVRYCSTMARR